MSTVDFDQYRLNRLNRPEDFRSGFDVQKTIEKLSEVPGINLPINKKQKKALSQSLQNATVGSPLTIYVGSCPDYSHNNGLYTHENVGSGVPLLTRVHADIDKNLLMSLDSSNIPYEYVVMVADIEAIDEVFCNKFTQGSREEFMARCMASSQASHQYLDNLAQENGLKGKVRGSSFFAEFGFEKFIQLQEQYTTVLDERYTTDDSFRMRVNSDIVKRMQMYNKMYDTVLPSLDYKARQDFLVSRDIRTKAQYLALGKAIIDKTKHSLVINHPTTNVGLINDRGKFQLPSDPTCYDAVPVFEIHQKVY